MGIQKHYSYFKDVKYKNTSFPLCVHGLGVHVLTTMEGI